MFKATPDRQITSLPRWKRFRASSTLQQREIHVKCAHSLDLFSRNAAPYHLSQLARGLVSKSSMTPRLFPFVLHIFQSYLIIIDFQFTAAIKTQLSFRTNGGEPSQCW